MGNKLPVTNKIIVLTFALLMGIHGLLTMVAAFSLVFDSQFYLSDYMFKFGEYELNSIFDVFNNMAIGALRFVFNAFLFTLPASLLTIALTNYLTVGKFEIRIGA